MPKSMIQSNWYYGENFNMQQLDDRTQKQVKAYSDLEAHGYDQIPTASFHSNDVKSISNTIQYCKKSITDSRLLGFLQTFWIPIIEGSDRHRNLSYRERILKGIELAGSAKKWFEINQK